MALFNCQIFLIFFLSYLGLDSALQYFFLYDMAGSLLKLGSYELLSNKIVKRISLVQAPKYKDERLIFMTYFGEKKSGNMEEKQQKIYILNSYY